MQIYFRFKITIILRNEQKGKGKYEIELIQTKKKQNRYTCRNNNDST